MYYLKIRFQDLGGIMNGVSIFTALLFGLLIHVFQLGLRLTDDPRVTNGSRVMRLIDQTQANIAYSVLVGLVTASAVGVVSATTEKDHAPGRLPSAILAALLVHLVMIILMALKRTNAAYRAFRF